MKIIVTGGCGFIGSHLVEILTNHDYEVFVIDDLSGGQKVCIPNTGTIHFYRCNIADGADVKHLTQRLSDKGKIDCLIHLAAKASIVPSVVDPALYHHVNVSGTLNALELAKDLGVKKFVYAASGSCYGTPKEIPTTENCPPDPQYPYALTKYLGEQYVAMWGNLYKLPYISLRLFNVFGPRMSLSGGYGGLFSTILPQMFNRKPVVVIGDGEQKRDFVYVRDAIRAFQMVMESDSVNRIFNIGMGSNVSVNQILNLLGVKESEVRRLPDRPGEPRETFADISLISKEVGWRPETTFENGLKNMISDSGYWKDARVWTYEKSVEAQRSWYEHFGRPLA